MRYKVLAGIAEYKTLYPEIAGLFSANLVIQLVPNIFHSYHDIVSMPHAVAQLTSAQWKCLVDLVSHDPHKLHNVPSFGLGTDIVIYKLNRNSAEMACPRLICVRELLENGSTQLWPLAFYESNHLYRDHMEKMMTGIGVLRELGVIGFQHGQYQLLKPDQLVLSQEEPSEYGLSKGVGSTVAGGQAKSISFQFSSLKELIQLLVSLSRQQSHLDITDDTINTFFHSLAEHFPSSYFSKSGLFVDKHFFQLTPMFKKELLKAMPRLVEASELPQLMLFRSFEADKSTLFHPVCRTLICLETDQFIQCFEGVKDSLFLFSGGSLDKIEALKPIVMNAMKECPKKLEGLDLLTVLGNQLLELDPQEFLQVWKLALSFSRERFIKSRIETANEGFLTRFLTRFADQLPYIFETNPLVWISTIRKFPTCHHFLKSFNQKALMPYELSMAGFSSDGGVASVESDRPVRPIRNSLASLSHLKFDEDTVDHRNFNKKLTRLLREVFSHPDCQFGAFEENKDDFLMACHLAVYQNNSEIKSLFLKFFTQTLTSEQRYRLVEVQEAYQGRYSLFDTACRALNSDALIAFLPYVDFTSRCSYKSEKEGENLLISNCATSARDFFFTLHTFKKAALERFLTRLLNCAADRLVPILGKLLFFVLEYSHKVQKIDHQYIQRIIDLGADIHDGLLVTAQICPKPLVSSKESSGTQRLYVNLSCAEFMHANDSGQYEGYLARHRKYKFPFLDKHLLTLSFPKNVSKTAFWKGRCLGHPRLFSQLDISTIPNSVLFSDHNLPCGDPFTVPLQNFRFFIDGMMGVNDKIFTHCFFSSSNASHLTIPRILLAQDKYEELLFLIRFRGLSPSFLMTPEFLNSTPTDCVFFECCTKQIKHFAEVVSIMPVMTVLDHSYTPSKMKYSNFIDFLTTLLKEYPFAFNTPLFNRFFLTLCATYSCTKQITSLITINQVAPQIFEFFSLYIDHLASFGMSESDITLFKNLLSEKQEVFDSAFERLSQTYPVLK
jgi:hypothetical protein